MKRLVDYTSIEWANPERALEVGKGREERNLAELKARGLPSHTLHSRVVTTKQSNGTWKYVLTVDYCGPDEVFFERIRKNAAPIRCLELSPEIRLLIEGYHPKPKCSCFLCRKGRAYEAIPEYHPPNCKCSVCVRQLP